MGMRFNNPKCCSCPDTPDPVFVTLTALDAVACDCLGGVTFQLDEQAQTVLPDPGGGPGSPGSLGHLARYWLYLDVGCAAIGRDLALELYCLGSAAGVGNWKFRAALWDDFATLDGYHIMTQATLPGTQFADGFISYTAVDCTPLSITDTLSLAAQGVSPWPCSDITPAVQTYTLAITE